MAERQHKRTLSLDATTTWTDPSGRRWTIGAEFKQIDGRLDFAALVIEPAERGYPITRRTLAQLPLRELFNKAIHREEIDFSRWRGSRREAQVHQGRASSDEELMMVAEVRSAALLANVPVQRAVAKALGISEGTAGNRIKAARTRGFIPPAGRRNRK